MAKKSRASRRWIVALFLTCLLAPLIGGCSRDQHRGVVAEPNSIRVVRGVDDAESSKQRAVVRLVNRGRSMVAIKDISTSCSCTVVSLPDARVIPAGGFTELAIEGDLPKFGRQVATVTIATDSTSTPVVTIRMELEGRRVPTPAVVEMPQELVIRATSNGSETEVFEVRTLESGDQSDWLTGFESSAPWLAVDRVQRQVVRQIPEADEVKYTFVASLSGQPGRGERWTAILTPATASPPVRPVGAVSVVFENPELITSVPREIVLRPGSGESFLTIFADGAVDAPCYLKSAPDWINVRNDPDYVRLVPGSSRFVVTCADAGPQAVHGILVFEVHLDRIVEFCVPCTRGGTVTGPQQDDH